MPPLLLVPSRVGGRIRRTALRLAIASARRVPSRGRALFERDGLDPVPALEESRTRGEVVPLLRLPGSRVWLSPATTPPEPCWPTRTRSPTTYATSWAARAVFPPNGSADWA